MIHPLTTDFAKTDPSRHEADAVHDARDLTKGRPTAQITLDDKVYTLRITRAGKLILTK